MDSSNAPAGNSSFPALFMVLSTFIGALIWLCTMLYSVSPF
jgi:hypothetical protein